jgi:hypothetical protein
MHASMSAKMSLSASYSWTGMTSPEERRQQLVLISHEGVQHILQCKTAVKDQTNALGSKHITNY